MIGLTALEPSAERVHRLDSRMRVRLADSLAYIAEQAAPVMPVPQAALASFLDRLRAGPVPPQVFGAYCDLVLAIEADALDEAAGFLDEIVAAGNDPEALRLISLSDEGEGRAASRYRRLFDTDPTVPFQMFPPPPPVAEECRARVGEALQLMDAGDPDLAREIRALLREVVIAVGAEGPGQFDFDGASTFMLWGAILLNGRSHKTRLEMVQALAHESGHNLLFGLCADGPLITNGEDERFSSPLRTDPRPMDGIVHATYVSARMHMAVRRLAQSGVLEPAEAAEADRALAATERAFKSGLSVVDEHALLTPLGQAVIGNARAYMAAA